HPLRAAMLSTLRIRRIGVIDDATLDFGPGFTALTGETGAGKTMIVTGLTMLLGGRLDRGRTSEASTVDGTLTLTGHEELTAAQSERPVRFGAPEIGPLPSRHRKAWRRRTELAGRLAELEEVLTERDRRGTALREALERIEQSDPQPGEDQALRTELERLGNA